MDPGILKYVFMNHVSQILENFPKKLKDILTYLFKTEKQIDISFETIPPLFQIDGSVVPTYHHVYIKHNKKPLILRKINVICNSWGKKSLIVVNPKLAIQIIGRKSPYSLILSTGNIFMFVIIWM